MSKFRVSLLVMAGLILAAWAGGLLGVLKADSLPQVELKADDIGPRPIEELTGRKVTRDYAYAWRDLAHALANNQEDSVPDYFTGFAKDNLRTRIAGQKQSGLQTRCIDHGHHVQAFFYSLDGGEMQLLDRAQIEMQIIDGGKVIHQENASVQYLVLMTPGADRWFVRSLEPIEKSKF